MTGVSLLRWLMVLLSFLSGVARADVFFERQNSVDESGRGYAVLMVLAEMTVADTKDFERHLKTIRKENLRLVDDSVWLKSVGGKRLAGFEIGRMIRRSHLATMVHEGDECDSACVWVLVGGVCRAAIGHVGLHRVVFSEPQYRRDLERDMAKRDQELKRYLMEMDVPLELWTIAHNTPSWGVSYLSDIRKRIYGLYTTLPAEQERRIAAYVRQTGESKQDVWKQLRTRELTLNSNREDDADYQPVPCSEQLLLTRPGSRAEPQP
jgi:hypothetical protein